MTRPSPIQSPALEAEKTLESFFDALMEKAQGLYPESEAPRKQAIIIHSALSAFGHVPGGADTVTRALCECARKRGMTLVMCAHSDAVPVSPGNGDGELPAIIAFDRRKSTCRGMGAIAERFRTFPRTRRSGHPTLSFTARGPLARTLLFPHRRESGVGPDSPAGRLRDLDALVLLIGVGYERCTILHLAEYARAARIAAAGGVADSVTCQAFERTIFGRWKSRVWTDIPFDPAVFPTLGERFEREMPGSVITIPVPRIDGTLTAKARIKVFRARAITEFCIDRYPDLR
ncbi:MAG TPA: AAC(3) family N-acetyltransferase [Treponemataceae bacterium]|nr:AAC(3) family N-acetyltransferase [Treponemataceae bacterium]